MRVVGLIGGVASGKSTVATELESRGAQVLNADHVVHALLEESNIKSRLKSCFGDSIFDSKGDVDRRAIAKIVFGSQDGATELRKKLEGILHPAVRIQAEKLLAYWRQQNEPVAVIDAPLLLEAGWAPMCDAILFVDTPQELRVQRSAKRGWSTDELQRRESFQLPLSDKRKQATHYIVNDGDINVLSERISAIWNEILFGPPNSQVES